MTVKLTINGSPVTAKPGQTILDAARASGVEIPTLCDHRELSAVGSCRLCLVEQAGLAEPVAACVHPVDEGMVIRTETPRLAAHRKLILEMLLADYFPPDDKAANGRGETEFERWIRHYGAEWPDRARQERRFPVDDDPNPFIRVDLNQCILCTRCVRVCEEVQGRFVWGVAERGRETRLIAGVDTTMLDARCESCGACAAVCPTGALQDRFAQGQPEPDRLVTTTCGYCGVGCQFDVNVKNDRVIGVTPNAEAPVNGISLCVKGRYGWDYVHHHERLLKPRVRAALLSAAAPSASGDRSSGRERGEWVEVDWDTALDLVAERFVEFHCHSGGDALGVLASAKFSNEENYLIQKLARQVFGTNNVDHCARLCHSSTVAGLAMCFGSGAMSNSLDDVARSAAAIFIIGSNTTEQHPVFGAMIRQAVLHRGTRLVVADPRKIDIAEFAELHIRQRPGTDVALINGLMHLILANGWHDSEFIKNRCEGFVEFEQTVAAYPPDVVCDITGVPIDQLHKAARILATNRPMAVVWAMGITQHTTGVLNVLSLGNLQMLLGNMGIAGGGVNPLRGQNNVQGACDMGALPNVFPGYQPVADEDNRRRFSDAWALQHEQLPWEASADVRPEASDDGGRFRLPDRPGLTVTEIIGAAGTGKIRGLYVCGENPVLTDPDSNHVRRCLANAEFVVVQEIFPSETSEYADVLLPGTSFVERTGTFTNTERRIQLFREAITPRGDARPDWEITCELARRILEREKRKPVGSRAGWDYESPSAIMDEIAELTPSYRGVSHLRLAQGHRLQWPVTGRDHSGTRILHVDRFTRGKGKFHAVDHLPPHELPDDDYPFLMTTGRVLYHWHGGEMTRRAQGLSAVYPEPLVEIAPDDAARLDLQDGRTVLVESRRGEMIAQAVLTERVSPGLIFANFHFPADQNANNLTIAALDPVAKIPEYKVCAVRFKPHR